MARRAGPYSAPPRRAAGAARRGGRRARQFFETYTRDMTAEDLQRLFTHETVEAYRYFARDIDRDQLEKLPPLKRFLARIRLFFLAFSMRLPPARRALFGAAVLISALGLINLFEGFRLVTVWLFPFGQFRVPAPTWADGTGAIALGTGLFALLVLLEVAGRLSLKHDLEIAREIQLAMLPRGVYSAEGIEAFGFTRPANTVGGDFFDILPISDGRVVVALGDVAGKASPAALLMALLLAIMRTLVDEGLEPTEMVSRLNVQTGRQAPGSRFITLFYACFDPRNGELTYVNAGHHPAAGATDKRRFRAPDGGRHRARDVRGIHIHTRPRRPGSRGPPRTLQRRHYGGRKQPGCSVRRSWPDDRDKTPVRHRKRPAWATPSCALWNATPATPASPTI